MSKTEEASATRYRLSVMGAWGVFALVLGLLLWLELQHIDHEGLTIARERGVTLFRLVETTREWNARHGGVYVPVGPRAQPNPYLEVPDRELTTIGGKTLTLINPAYMTRQIAELSEMSNGARIHITSLRPIRPANAPDDWERAALESFERGADERLERMLADGQPVHRYMAPLRVGETCLRCHEKQGYRLGDIRGGISVTMPAALTEASLAAEKSAALTGSVLVFLMLGGLSHLVLYRNRQMLDRLAGLSERQEDEIRARTAELASERARYRAMAEMSSDWFWEQDEHFRFVGFSGDRRDKGGLPIEQMVGHTRWELPQIEAEAQAMAAHRALIERHQPFEGFEYRILNRYGELRCYQIAGRPVFAADGRFSGYIGTGLDITTRKRREQMLRALTEDTSRVFGPAYFTALVRHLGAQLGVRYCFVAKIYSEGRRARSVAVYDAEAEGEAGAFDYALEGTPCEQVGGQEVCIFADTVAERFPRDEQLRLMGAQSYMGVPIKDAHGSSVGILAVLDTRPLKVEPDVAELMQIFAARAGIEFERMEIERELRESERVLKQAEMIADVGSWELDLQSYELTWSEQTFRIFELDPGQFRPTYQSFLEAVHPEDRALVAATYEGSVRNHAPYEIEHRLRLADGRIKQLLERGETLYDEGGAPLRTRGMVQDVSAQRAADDRLRLAASVFSATRDGVLITDGAANIVDANPSLCRASGYARDELLGHNPRLFSSGRHDLDFFAQVWSELRSQGTWQGEIWNRRKDGRIEPELLSISAVREDSGRISHYIGVYTDISALKAQQRELEQQAHHDALTGLPNRRLLLDRLALALAQAERARTRVAVAFLDLDEFKPVNDRLGHEAGDELLMLLAHRLQAAVRGGDSVARLGGDEFVLVLVGLQTVSEIEPTLARVLTAVARPCHVAGHETAVSASIGVAIFPEDGDDPDTLMQRADAAMYDAKRDGRNRYRLYRGSDRETG